MLLSSLAFDDFYFFLVRPQMSKHQNKFSYLKLECKAQGIKDYTEIIFCNTPNNFPCIFYSTV